MPETNPWEQTINVTEEQTLVDQMQDLIMPEPSPYEQEIGRKLIKLFIEKQSAANADTPTRQEPIKREPRRSALKQNLLKP